MLKDLETEKDPIDSEYSGLWRDVGGAAGVTLSFLALLLFALCDIQIRTSGGISTWLEKLNFRNEFKDISTYFGGMAVIAALVIPVAIQLHTSIASLHAALPRDTVGKWEEKSAEDFTEKELRALGEFEGRVRQSFVINFAASIGIAFLYSRGTLGALDEFDIWAVLDTFFFASLFLFIIWFSSLRELRNLIKYEQMRKELTDEWARHSGSAWARFAAYRLFDEKCTTEKSAFRSGEKWWRHSLPWALGVALYWLVAGGWTVAEGGSSDDYGWFFIFVLPFSFAVFVFLFFALMTALGVLRVFSLSGLLSSREEEKSSKRGRWAWVPTEHKVGSIFGIIIAFSLTAIVLLMGWSVTYIPGNPYEGKAGLFIAFLIILGVSLFIFLLYSWKAVERSNYKTIYDGKIKKTTRPMAEKYNPVYGSIEVVTDSCVLINKPNWLPDGTQFEPDEPNWPFYNPRSIKDGPLVTIVWPTGLLQVEQPRDDLHEYGEKGYTARPRILVTYPDGSKEVTIPTVKITSTAARLTDVDYVNIWVAPGKAREVFPSVEGDTPVSYEFIVSEKLDDYRAQGWEFSIDSTTGCITVVAPPTEGIEMSLAVSAVYADNSSGNSNAIFRSGFGPAPKSGAKLKPRSSR